MYIAIEGVIGVGKTTLARMLQPGFEAELQLEVFEENPFLADFYSDRERYAFQTQIFFLLSRYHQQRRGVKNVVENGRHLITDYTFAKDQLFARINLKGDELEVYYEVHKALGEKVRLPDLIVHLTADIETVMQRIALRDRSYERNMETEYIASLAQAYRDYYEFNYQGPPVLTVDTTRLNIVSQPADFYLIEKRVRETLKETITQQVLPLDADPAGNN